MPDFARPLRRLAAIEDLTVVGTTSLRTLESAFWLASRWKAGGPGAEVDVAQWIHRDVEPGFADFREAAGWLADRVEAAGELEFVTHLMVVPGYRVRSARRLLTNFHMPNRRPVHCRGHDRSGVARGLCPCRGAGLPFPQHGDACLLERSSDHHRQTGVCPSGTPESASLAQVLDLGLLLDGGGWRSRTAAEWQVAA